MATLTDLVNALATATGLPTATVYAYGRFGREAGLLSQHGRGRAAAKITHRDAANLLIAIGATDTTREAGNAIREFRNLRGWFHLPPHDALDSWTRKWLAQFDIQPQKRQLGPGQPKIHIDPSSPEYTLSVNFGQFLEWLLLEIANGNFVKQLAEIEVTDTSDMTASEKEAAFDWTTEELLSKTNAKRKSPATITFGPRMDLSCSLEFDRTDGSVAFSLERQGIREEQIFLILFEPKFVQTKKDFSVTASLTLNTIAAAALIVGDHKIPKKRRDFLDPLANQLLQDFIAPWEE